MSSSKTYAPVELLPVELFDQIIPLLAVDTPTNGYAPRNKDLASCLLVSRTFYRMTLSTLYKRVTFPHSTIFSKFLTHISNYPELGGLVRRLDFSTFTSVGLGRTRKMQSEIQKLTATTLLKCLSLTPYVREFLGSEAMDEDMDGEVLQKLFCDMEYLEAIDFCALTVSKFTKGMIEVLSESNTKLPEKLPLRRVGLHACSTLPPSVFSALLPRLPHLTHLDLTHTQLTDGALNSIPHTARLTHLSISKCNKLHGPAVVDFLINHPAAQSLVVLNLHFDTSRYRLLSTQEVDDLLPHLPNTLRSLNLNGAKINSSHVPQLRRLAGFLEEMSIGSADLSVEDINGIFRDEDDKTHRSNLRYLCLSGVSSVTPNNIIFPDTCALLNYDSFPLQVLEFSDKVLDGLKDRPMTSKKLGWIVKTQARRGWYVRAGTGTLPGGEKIAKDLAADDGWRPWKMGGYWWGARKIPMAVGEVSGIYGYYAFGY